MVPIGQLGQVIEKNVIFKNILMNNKILKVSVIVILILLFFCSIFLVYRRSSDPKQLEQGPGLSISTSEGTVKISNFFDKAEETIGDIVVVATTLNFQIIYFKKNEVFNITLKLKPLETSRDLAETRLLEVLDISQAEACKLNVEIFVPIALDEKLAGNTFGLSLCPNSNTF